jgi:hypothetical protein
MCVMLHAAVEHLPAVLNPPLFPVPVFIGTNSLAYHRGRHERMRVFMTKYLSAELRCARRGMRFVVLNISRSCRNSNLSLRCSR